MMGVDVAGGIMRFNACVCIGFNACVCIGFNACDNIAVLPEFLRATFDH